jgi:WD repeat-containing protein 42A
MNWHTMGGRNQPPASSPAVTSYIPNLGSRQLSHDPLQGLSRLQERCYGLPSVVRRLNLQHRLEAHEGCVNCINFSGSGQLLASGSDDLHVVVWDWEQGRMVSKLESGHISNIFQVCTLTLCVFCPVNTGVSVINCIRYCVFYEWCFQLDCMCSN